MLDASRIRPHLYVIPIAVTTTKLQFGKTDGSTWVWTLLRRQVGHGEGVSALRFDQLLEPVPAGQQCGPGMTVGVFEPNPPLLHPRQGLGRAAFSIKRI
jgi:hypothetical protein